MARFEHSIDIGRPPSEVFAYLTDLSKLPEWQSGVVEARWEGEKGPGARAKQVREMRGRRTEAELQVAAYEPDRRFALKTLSGPIAFSVDFTLEPKNGGTRLSVSGEGEPEGLAKVAGPIVGRKIQKEFKRNFETLKGNLEAGR
jgi:carbon monoxide dehydrogenase subunit G